MCDPKNYMNCDANQASLCESCPNKIDVEQLILSMDHRLHSLKSCARHALACERSKDIVFLAKQFDRIMDALDDILNHDQKAIREHPITQYMTHMLRNRAYTPRDNYPQAQLIVERMAEIEVET